MTPPTSRRQFLQATSAAALVGGALSAETVTRAQGLGSRTLRIALVGCGGRGGGAAVQALATGDVKLVAMADAFENRLAETHSNLVAECGDKVDVPEDQRFVGFDAFQKAMDVDVDVVILATPPGFRPSHFEYAVAKGRHVFMEKPVAVDGPGVRQVLAAARVAKEKNLKVGVGLQRHHEPPYIETVRRIKEGAIGDIVLLRSYWNSGGVWVNDREPGESEMRYQMRNWYYFNWLCGDHIVEQHIHNLDVANWVMGDYPAVAQGQGGRQVRTDKKYGEIFDHHMVEFTYASGAKLLSQCRHIPDTWGSVSEHAHGTHGTANISGASLRSTGGWTWRYEGERPNPYQVEHDVLFKAVREDLPHNEAEYGAKSSLTSIMGRMATYTGKEVTWEAAMNSEVSLMPKRLAWDAEPPTLPLADGSYPIPMPGKQA